MLPAPNLDDRRFQDLVDDAKRLIQQRCPEWTDHNVSDPGVTLVETFAYMVDQLLYRLNRVPDRNYVKFLEMIGVRLFPPTAARCPVTFWLSAAQAAGIDIPAGAEVATIREDGEEPPIFTTVETRTIVPCTLRAIGSHPNGGTATDGTARLGDQGGMLAFQEQPQPGDCLLVGLSDPVPGCAVVLRFDCHIEGVGVDPDDPPIVWEAYDGSGWALCEIDVERDGHRRDGTKGLNRSGDIVLHVPASHTGSVLMRRRAGWLRGRLTEPVQNQPFYRASPRVDQLEAFTIGATVDAVHARIVDDEDLGVSDGVPGQHFLLRHRPVVPGERPPVIEVAERDGWQTWTAVENFAHSEATDRHFVLDAVSGEVQLGPAVRGRSGALRQFGAVPEKGARVRIPTYRTGGGSRGNVARHSVVVPKTNIPFVASVTNRRAATGGVDAEDIENAKTRGPVILRTRNRAVTGEDYEHRARLAAPEVARVRCVPADADGDANAVRVLVVPTAVEADGQELDFRQLNPSEQTLSTIASEIEKVRCIGARVVVERPEYLGLTVVARVRARASADAERLAADAVTELHRYFHPLHGGPERNGWPFGRPVLIGEVYGVLQAVRGTEFVEEALLFPADALSGQPGRRTDRLEIPPNALVFSRNHQVEVVQ